MSSLFIFLFYLPMMVMSHKPCSEIFQRISAPETGMLLAQFEVLIYRAELASEDFTSWKSEITFNYPINITQSNVTVAIRSLKWDTDEFPIDLEYIRMDMTSNQTASFIIKLEKEEVESFWFSIKFIIFLEITYQSTYIDVDQFVLNNKLICAGGNACGVNRYSTLLVHKGVGSKAGKWPWLVALHKKDPIALDFFCAGTLVSTKHVITAAHCLRSEEKFYYDFKNILVALGTKTNLDARSEIKLNKVSDFIVHHDWGIQRNGKRDGDIAILILEKEVTFTIDIQPACLDFSENVEKFGTIVGWGFNEYDFATGDVSQEVVLPIVSNDICNKSDVRFHFLASERTICAGFKNGSGPCSGDSGGGLYTTKTLPGDIPRYSLTGIISRSLSQVNITCDLSKYSIYTRISAYKNWIKYIVQSNTNSINNHDFVRELLYDFSKLQLDVLLQKSSIWDREIISKLEKDIKENKKELENNILTINFLDSSKKLCNYERTVLQTQHNNTLLELKRKENRISSLESNVINSQKRISQIEDENTELTKKINNLKTYIEAEHELAVKDFNNGDYQKALTRFNYVYESSRSLLGEDNVDTLNSLGWKADTLRELKKYNEAITNYDVLIEKRKKLLGVDHADTLKSMHKKAYTLDKMGRYQDAIDLYEIVIGKRKKVLGDEHADTLRSMHDKAFTLQNMGQYRDAIDLFDIVIIKQKKVLGEKHASTLQSIKNKAATLKKMG